MANQIRSLGIQRKRKKHKPSLINKSDEFVKVEINYQLQFYVFQF